MCSDGRNCTTSVQVEPVCVSLEDDPYSPAECAPPCSLAGCRSVVMHDVLCSTYSCSAPPSPPPSAASYGWIIALSVLLTLFGVLGGIAGGLVVLVRRHRAQTAYGAVDDEGDEMTPIIRPSVEAAVIDAADAVSSLAAARLERRRLGETSA